MTVASDLPGDDPHNTIRLGDETAVVVPLDEYLRLREAKLEAEQLAAALRSRERAATGEVEPGMTTEQVRRFLGLTET
ncbi:hypothetical protein [Actinomadura sp. WMMB 499]|uniref:hypothetical protein n=1 Tax=Actinomadura sp. WMMB 499 TaxID=1219491 RepID=UPI001244BEEE|nr:hypothetical protein [Actinomadura sp. WMMB 499]QFG25519.1 hypothetical protein F7P10_34650 [Actinomadura sp. WMMB 499]